MEIKIDKYNTIKTKNRNLLSFVIFKMIGPYREFNKYLNHLKSVIDIYFTKIFESNYDMRIYFDNSCKNEINAFIKSYKEIEFYQFNYEPLRVGEFHNGTFGSIIRLLPLFDKEDISYEHIWLDDIDIYDIDFSIMKFFEINSLKKIQTIASSMFCYDKPWAKNKYNLNFPIITSVKLDMNILLQYLDDIVHDKYKDIIDEILKYRSDKFKYDYDIKFPYGMDEYFTNNIIYKDLTRSAYTIYDFNLTRKLRKIYVSNVIQDSREVDIVKQLLSLDKTLWKVQNKTMRNDIINTYIRLLNRIDQKNLKNYFIKINSLSCLNEFYKFLKTSDIKTMTNFHKMLQIL